MGRSNKNKKRRNSGQNNNQGTQGQQQQKKSGKNKRQRRERFWIEDCEETTIAADGADTSNSMEILITRVELLDNFRQAPQPRNKVEKILDKEVKDENAANEHTNDETAESTLKEESVEKGSDDINDERLDKDCEDAKEEDNDTVLPKEDKNLKETANQKHEENAITEEDPEDKPIDADTEEIFSPVNQEASSLEDTPLIVGKTTTSTATEENGGADPETQKGDTSTEDDHQPPEGSAESISQKKLVSPNDVIICIKKSRSAKRPIKRIFDPGEEFEPLQGGDCGDGIKNPHPKDEVPDKFWAQRRRLFTRFDEGIQLDKESWYSVTPEAIANSIASRFVGGQEQGLTVLDPFCGCGGNAIAFAHKVKVQLVVCVDNDLSKLQKAANNASIYGIPPEKMLFICANACKVLDMYNNGSVESKVNDEEKSEMSEKVLKTDIEGTAMPAVTSCQDFKIGGLDLLPKSIDMIFLSPPWGGLEYLKVGKRGYGLSQIRVEKEDGNQIDGNKLLSMSARAVGQRPIALFLPRNINGINLGRSALKAGIQGPLVMEQNILNGKLKTVTAYMGS